MKISHLIQTLLSLIVASFSASALAAPEPQLTGKDLLIAVVANQYPTHPRAYGCEDFFPSFSNLRVDSGCYVLQKEAPQIAFIGDSHNNHYVAAALTKFQSINPIVISQTACFPFAADAWREDMKFVNGLRDEICEKKQKKLLDYLINAANIKTVVISSRWSALMSGPDVARGGEGWLKLAGMSEEDKKSFIADGHQFLSAVLKAGKRVILMRDIPDLDFDSATCYNIRPVRLGNSEIRKDCSMAQEPFELRRQLQNAVLDEMLKPFPAVEVYDPVPLFCKNGRCKASDGTLPYYLNGDHVNSYGAQFVFKDFVPKFFPDLSPAAKTK